MIQPESEKTPAELLTQPSFDIKPGKPVELIIPGDPPRDDSKYWFVDTGTTDPLDPLWLPEPRRGNEAMYLLGGEDTYNAMADALETTYGAKDAFIYLCNWTINFDFNLKRKGKKSEAGTTLQHYLTTAANDHGVMVRGIFWFRTRLMDADQNRVERDYINTLKNGHAYLDGRHNLFGSHHQKLLLVNGSEGLIAFVGGIDFNYDRVFALNEAVPSPEGDLSNGGMMKDHKCTDAGSPLLDVHTRIRGPAAYDFLDIFTRRYSDHSSAYGTRLLVPHLDRRPKEGMRCMVRAGATFGDSPNEHGAQMFTPGDQVKAALAGPAKPGDPAALVQIDGNKDDNRTASTSYWFAPKGRRSGFAQVIWGIKSARRYIYFEDQYMVSQEIAEAVRDAVARGVKLIGVVPHQYISPDFDEAGKHDLLGSVRRSRFIQVVYGEKADPNTIDAFYCPVWDQKSRNVPERYQYIHSKVFIFDDAFCTIGSMNLNKRSTTNDSELCAGFYEYGSWSELSFSFAHRMRMRLWARHLNIGAADFHLLADPLFAIENYWKKVELGNSPIKVNGKNVTPNVQAYDWSRDTPLADIKWSDGGMGSEAEVDTIFEPGINDAMKGKLGSPDLDPPKPRFRGPYVPT